MKYKQNAFIPHPCGGAMLLLVILLFIGGGGMMQPAEILTFCCIACMGLKTIIENSTYYQVQEGI